jgi:hypothetical protein
MYSTSFYSLVSRLPRDSTHTFSPKTGLIHMHRIDSIRPEPHQTAYNALRASLVNVFGLGEHQGACAVFEREVV